MMCFNQKWKTYDAFKLVHQNYKLLVAQYMCCLTLYFGLSLEAWREKVVNLSHDGDFSIEFELISFFKTNASMFLSAKIVFIKRQINLFTASVCEIDTSWL